MRVASLLKKKTHRISKAICQSRMGRVGGIVVGYGWEGAEIGEENIQNKGSGNA